MPRLASSGGARGTGKEFAVAGGEGPRGDDPKGDPPHVRMVKYIPAESVTFFLGVKNVIEGSTPPKPQGDLWTNVCFVIALIGTPVYLYLQREKGKPWIVNTVFATVAFPIWVYALDCKFGWFASPVMMIAGILVLAYTFLVGMVKPIK